MACLKIVLLLSIVLQSQLTSCAKILAVFPIPSYSHQVVGHPIWRELSLRGHQVTLITTDPINDPTLTNLTEIDLSFTYKLWNEKHNITGVINDNNGNMFRMMNRFIEMLHDIMDQELGHPEVQKIIKDPNQHFDLLMVEYLQFTTFGFKHRFNCPMIGLTTLEAPSSVHELLGNPSHPVLYPDFSLPIIAPLTFFERVISSVFYIFISIYGNSILPNEDLTIAKHFGPGYPTIFELRQQADMLFINSNPALQSVRPVAPSTIYIGGGIHLKKPKPLPKDIKQFLDNAKEGVVYFSLGSNVKSKDIPDKTRQVILETFRELPYKVLWKFEAESLPGKPDNVHIMKWIPQQDVLRHPNIKLFITQGGLQSTEEAIFSHVPVVVMPFFGDQEMNAKRIVSKGFGLSVDHKTLVKEEFKEVLTEVLTNKIYRDKAKELAELALDEPMTGLEKAIWWTEYVLRHKGAKHLKGPAVNLPLYQYYFLDVIAFFVGILTVLITILVLIFKCLKCFLCGKKRKVKTN